MSLALYFEKGVNYLHDPKLAESSEIMRHYDVPQRYSHQIALLIDNRVLGEDAERTG